MRQPDYNIIYNTLFERLKFPVNSESLSVRLTGKIVKIGPTLLRASLPGVSLAEFCHLKPSGIDAEVVSIDGDYALLSPFSEPLGVTVGSDVIPTGHCYQICVGDFLLGRVLDGLGRPLDHSNLPQYGEYRTLNADVPNPLLRQIIDTHLPLGVRAIDGLLTCGIGQRIGIFAAAGCGKSTLLGMISEGCESDIIVLALIGERGREVREFLEHTLTPQALKRCVIVIATSDRSTLERLKAAYTATTIAEYFRDQGKNVLLMMDSLTRFARASREIGLAAGECATSGGYPPSFYAQLPRLLERAGRAESGSITAIYTVLVEGDNMNEPVSDEVRSILDGHIVLSRKLAQENHYPAIDINASISRVMVQVTSEQHRKNAGKLRKLQAAWKDIELLVRVGEYQTGQDPESDEALMKRPIIREFLCQPTDERVKFQDTLDMLCKIIKQP
ncbi:type III secretion system ATPase SctN [Providencia sp. VP23HZSY-1]|uniref:type III secretion system ATPase SctN n=1 Tax=Providencia sp. VP23HZSY-1 TaxID=3391806 RepID=UPI003AF62AB6